MELKEAYIDEIVCHHYSVDPTMSLMNNGLMDMAALDANVLKEFFIKPFANVKTEYCFSHPVDLSYNIIYQTALKVLDGEDFVKCSQDVFRHLQSVSTLPTIKDGDVFVAKVSDILVGDGYYEGLGIFKIERKSEFIETYLDENGNMQFAIKNGFSSNRIDKACLTVFTEKIPKCYLIDTSKDTKFWRQDFLGLVPMANSYSQSKAVMAVFQSFMNEELKERVEMTKEEQVSLLNRWSEQVKTADVFQMKEAAQEVLGDKNVADMFAEYCRVYEEQEGVKLSGSFDVDKKAVTLPKKVRTIKLDDTAEINLLKTGGFIERGYDEGKGMNYYKLYFSKEK